MSSRPVARAAHKREAENADQVPVRRPCLVSVAPHTCLPQEVGVKCALRFIEVV